MLIRTCVTFWSMVISYKKAINLDQNKLFLNTKIREHCASTKCLNGSQIFELGTTITLGVYLGPPCRLVCKLVIGNSVWHQGGVGRLQPQALADLLSPGVAAHCQILHLHLCPQDMWVRSVTGCAGGQTSPLHNNSQSGMVLRRFFPWLFFALRLLNSRGSQKNSDY